MYIYYFYKVYINKEFSVDINMSYAKKKKNNYPFMEISVHIIIIKNNYLFMEISVHIIFLLRNSNFIVASSLITLFSLLLLYEIMKRFSIFQNK